MTDTMDTREKPLAVRGEPPVRRLALARHSLALAQRSLIKTRRNPGVLMDAVFVPVMFLVLFVYLFGGAVSGSTQEYLQHLFPGILVMSTTLVGLLATGLNINTDIKKGIFDRFRSLPIGRSAPLIGSVVGDLIRYVVAAAVVFGFGYLMGFRVETDLVSALGAAALGLPTETMPGWLQAWADVNPVSYAMQASQGLLLGGQVAEPAVMTLLWSAIILAVFGPLAVQAYQRRA